MSYEIEIGIYQMDQGLEFISLRGKRRGKKRRGKERARLWIEKSWKYLILASGRM